MIKNNVILGKQNEQKLKPIIEKYFNIKLSETKDYDEFDFIDNNDVYYEIKTRFNTYNKYPTTMIGYNKIKKINELNKESIFIFSFTDGNYYYKYNKDDNLEIKKGGRTDRGKQEIKDYLFIPILLLKKII